MFTSWIFPFRGSLLHHIHQLGSPPRLQHCLVCLKGAYSRDSSREMNQPHYLFKKCNKICKSWAIFSDIICHNNCRNNCVDTIKIMKMFIEWWLKASALESEFLNSNSASDAYQLTPLHLSLLICKMTIVYYLLHRVFERIKWNNPYKIS